MEYEKHYSLFHDGITTALTGTNMIEPSSPPVKVGRNVHVCNDGSRMFVGTLKSESGASMIGDVFIYTKTATGWTFETSLYPLVSSTSYLGDHISNSGQYHANFGASIRSNTDGTVLYVSASGHSMYANARDGAVLRFEYSGGSWSVTDIIKNSGKIGSGLACSSDGATVFIGSQKSSAANINVFRYTYTSESGLVKDNLFNIKPTDLSGNTNFGSSLACSGDGLTLVVGSNNYSYQTSSGQTRYPGNVQIFKDVNGVWTKLNDCRPDLQLYRSNLVFSNGQNIGNVVSMSSDGMRCCFSANITTAHTPHPRYGVVSVYVFNQTSGVFEVEQIIEPHEYNTSSGYFFGGCCYFVPDGTQLFVSIPSKQVYSYVLDSTNSTSPWQLHSQSQTTQNIESYITTNSSSYSQSSFSSNFGSTISSDSSGEIIVIGIPQKYVGSNMVGDVISLKGKGFLSIRNVNDSYSIAYGESIQFSPVVDHSVSPNYLVPTSSNGVYTFDAQSSTLTVIGQGSTEITLIYSETNEYFQTEKNVQLTTQQASQRIVIDHAEIEVTGSIGIGQQSGLLFHILNETVGVTSQLTPSITISGTNISYDPISNLVEGLSVGTSTLTITQQGDINHIAAFPQSFTYTVNSQWTTAYPPGYSSVPSLQGIAFEDTQSLSNIDNISIETLRNFNFSKQFIPDDNKIIYNIPLDDTLAFTNLRRNKLKRDNSDFSVEIKDFTNSSINHVSMSLTKADNYSLQNSSFGQMTESDRNTILNLDNITDIITINKYDSTNQKISNDYVTIRLYHPHDTIVLYHISDTNVLTKIETETFSDISIQRDSVDSNYWWAKVPFSSVVGGSGESSVGGSIGDPYIVCILE